MQTVKVARVPGPAVRFSAWPAGGATRACDMQLPPAQATPLASPEDNYNISSVRGGTTVRATSSSSHVRDVRGGQQSMSWTVAPDVASTNRWRQKQQFVRERDVHLQGVRHHSARGIRRDMVEDPRPPRSARSQPALQKRVVSGQVRVLLRMIFSLVSSFLN